MARLLDSLRWRNGRRRSAAQGSASSDSTSPSQLYAEAVRLYQDGQMSQAQAMCDRAVALDPACFDALHLLAVIAQRAGDSTRAIRHLRDAIAIFPDHAGAQSNLGLIYLALGDLDAAEGCLTKAVTLRPDWDRGHANLGNLHCARGDREAARRCYLEALRLNDSNADALNNLANLHKDTGDHQTAERLYQMALRLRPGAPEICDNLGSVYLELGAWEQAIASFESALAAGGGAPVHAKLGFALLQTGRLYDAEKACRKALALDPRFVPALIDLSSILLAQGDLDAAASCCRLALECDPANAKAEIGLGVICREGGDSRGAEAHYERALALDPRSAIARYNLGIVQLARGSYQEGFHNYESRFDAFDRTFGGPRHKPFLSQPTKRWRGEPLAGQRLLVWTDHGLGDSLMMLRYLRQIRARGAARVVVLCEPELERLISTCPGVDDVVTDPSADLSSLYDLHVPMMSLPHAFRTTLATVPSSSGCIGIAHRARRGSAARVSIGLAWAGSPALRDDAKRSVPLSLFGRLLEIQGIELVSLQKGDAAREASGFGAVGTHRIEQCRDLMDTASLIAELDLVISVDTSVAHLAGIVGCPVWLLNRSGSEWRWGFESDRSVWYHSMRIFRQQRSMDWDSVVACMVEELRCVSPGDGAQDPQWKLQ